MPPTTMMGNERLRGDLLDVHVIRVFIKQLLFLCQFSSMYLLCFFVPSQASQIVAQRVQRF